MMPTRYLLELYNENADARYNAWFREEYKLNTAAAYFWTKDQLDYFENRHLWLARLFNREKQHCFLRKKDC